MNASGFPAISGSTTSSQYAYLASKGDLPSTASSNQLSNQSLGEIGHAANVTLSNSSTSNASYAVLKGNLSPDGSTLAFLDAQSDLMLSSTTHTAHARKIGRALTHGQIAFSKNGRYLAYTTETGDIFYRTLKSAAIASNFVERSNIKGEFTFSSDNDFLLVPRLKQDQPELEARKNRRIRQDQLENESPKLTLKHEKLKQQGELEAKEMNKGGEILIGTMIALGFMVTIPFSTVFATGIVAAAGVTRGAVHLKSASSNYKNVKQNADETAEKLEETQRDISILQEQMAQEQVLHPRLDIEYISLQTGTVALKNTIPTTGLVTFAGFSGDGERVIVVEDNQKVSVWPRRAQVQEKPEKTFLARSDDNQGPDFITKIVASPSGNLLAVVKLSDDKESETAACKVWLCQPTESEEANVLAQFNMNIKDILNLSFSPDEKWLAALDADNQLVLLSTELKNVQIIDGIWSKPIHTISWTQTPESELRTINEENGYSVDEWKIIPTQNGKFVLEVPLPQLGESFIMTA